MQIRTMLLSAGAALAFTASVSGATKYVTQTGGGLMDGSTWGDAYANPHDALATANPGDLIFVAAGTYKPTTVYNGGGAQSKTFDMKRGVEMYGGFAGTETALNQRNPAVNQTILSGDLDNDNTLDADNAWHVVQIHWIGGNEITPSTKIDGFTITMGYADGGGLDDYGGGMLIYEASPVVQNCVFINNHAALGGGGLCVDGPTVFTDPPPEVALEQPAHPTIRACRFLGNDSDDNGGGVFVINGDAQMVCCELSGNLADADGGGIYIATHPIAYHVNSTAACTNCTFANNTGNGRSIYNGDELGVANTIMWDAGSTAGHIVEDNPSVTTSIADSNIEGDSSTTNADPKFLSEKGGDATAGTVDDDFRLDCSSPSINIGLSSIPDDTYDVDDDGATTGTGGEPTPTVVRKLRVIQTYADQGAHESKKCGADVTGNGSVNVQDLLAVITQWGCTGTCSADVNACLGDGVVNVADLLTVISNWGDCDAPPIGELPQDYYDCESMCTGLTGEDWIKCMNACFAVLCANGQTEFCED